MSTIYIADRAEGWPERIRWDLLKYMWTFEYRLNNRLLNQLRDLKGLYPQVTFIEISNKKQLTEVWYLLTLHKYR